MNDMDDDKKNEKKNGGSIGCFIITFIIIAAGIPAATKGEGPIGTLVIIIAGLALAFYLARALSGND